MTQQTKDSNLETKTFYQDRTDRALKELQDNGYRALFMPELADLKINSDRNSEYWSNWYTAPSIKATGIPTVGRFKGKPADLYVHTNNYFSNPDNITHAIDIRILRFGAGYIPQTEFDRLALLEAEDAEDELVGRLVYAVDYDKLREYKFSVIKVSDALEHPQVIPFFGGEERAERYLKKHGEIFGDRIEVYRSHDLSDEPLGRLLYLGFDCGNEFNRFGSYLGGNNHLEDSGQFVGVRKSTEGASQKISLLDEISKYSERYVLEKDRAEYLKGLEERLRSNQ